MIDAAGAASVEHAEAVNDYRDRHQFPHRAQSRSSPAATFRSPRRGRSISAIRPRAARSLPRPIDRLHGDRCQRIGRRCAHRVLARSTASTATASSPAAISRLPAAAHNRGQHPDERIARPASTNSGPATLGTVDTRRQYFICLRQTAILPGPSPPRGNNQPAHDRMPASSASPMQPAACRSRKPGRLPKDRSLPMQTAIYCWRTAAPRRCSACAPADRSQWIVSPRAKTCLCSQVRPRT